MPALTGADPFPERVSQMATSLANTQSRAELSASRARIVAAADETRRRLERDLHDGIQQRLVSLGAEGPEDPEDDTPAR
jgi:signal transduction histidine kinase